MNKLFILISTLILITPFLWAESWAKTHNLSCQVKRHAVPNMSAQVFLNAQFVEVEGNEFYDYAIDNGRLSAFLHDRNINYHHTSTVSYFHRKNIQEHPDESESAFHLPLLSSQREMLFVFSREILKDENQLKEFTAYATVTDLPGVTIPLNCQLIDLSVWETYYDVNCHYKGPNSDMNVDTSLMARMARIEVTRNGHRGRRERRREGRR